MWVWLMVLWFRLETYGFNPAGEGYYHTPHMQYSGSGDCVRVPVWIQRSRRGHALLDGIKGEHPYSLIGNGESASLTVNYPICVSLLVEARSNICHCYCKWVTSLSLKPATFDVSSLYIYTVIYNTLYIYILRRKGGKGTFWNHAISRNTYSPNA